MGIQRKHIILLILGQTACVAVGLWVHESLLVAMARDDAPSEALGWLTSHLATVGGVALLWTAGLLAVVLYLTLARFCGQQETGREKAAADALRQAERLVRTRDAVIFGLAKLADSRDPETGDHLERICEYSAALAGAMRHHPRFRDQISANFVKLIGISAALHDIGKVGVEDRILRKPGPLTKAERAQMQTHTTIGAECLAQIERRLGSTNFLQMARQIALAHHERWDGAGYPEGLAGEAIPLAARIVAVADVYDALASRRVYKEPIIHETCIEIVRAGAGSQFDPDIIAVLLQIEWKFNEIVRHFKEPPLEADETSPVTTSEGPEPIEDEFLADVQTEIE